MATPSTGCAGWRRSKRLFDVVLLDPPTFSQSKESGVFRAEKDYGRLVAAALPLLRSGGVLFASTNAAGWPPEEFLAERGGGHPRRKPESPPAPLRAAAAGFPDLASRAGLSEDRLAANRSKGVKRLRFKVVSRARKSG